VGPRVGLDAMSKRKIPSPRRDSNPDHPITQLVGIRYTDGAVPAVRISSCFYRTVIPSSQYFLEMSRGTRCGYKQSQYAILLWKWLINIAVKCMND
jgi:hypothetical protein